MENKWFAQKEIKSSFILEYYYVDLFLVVLQCWEVCKYAFITKISFTLLLL